MAACRQAAIRCLFFKQRGRGCAVAAFQHLIGLTRSLQPLLDLLIFCRHRSKLTLWGRSESTHYSFSAVHEAVEAVA